MHIEPRLERVGKGFFDLPFPGGEKKGIHARELNKCRQAHISFFFHPREKVGRKTPAPLFQAEIRVSKTRRRKAETGPGGRHPMITSIGPH